MKRIYDFYSFSKLYEEEEKKVSDFENLIQTTLSNILGCYNKQLPLAKNPDDAKKKMIPDYDSVAASPSVDSLKKILDGAKSLAADDAKDPSEAYAKAGESFLGVLSKIYELLPNSKEDINKIIVEFMGKAKGGLQQASRDNPASGAINKLLVQAKENSGGEKKLNASVEYFYDEIISEGALDFLKGKKGKLKDISYQVSLELANLRSKTQEELKSVVAQQVAELTSIGEEAGKLAGKKNRDISDEDIEKLRERLAEVPKKIQDKEAEMVKKNNATKDVSPLFVKATQDLSAANDKFDEYKTKKDAEKEKKQGEEAEKEKEKVVSDKKKEIGFSKTITKKDIGDKKDETVKKIQKLIDRKFGDKIKDSEAFTKFTTGKFAGDGYFGNNTEKVIKGIKAGLGMKSDDSDITEELIDKILSLKESKAFEYGRFKSFDSFESLNEKYYRDVKFDLDKFLEVADGKKPKKKEESENPWNNFSQEEREKITDKLKDKAKKEGIDLDSGNLTPDKEDFYSLKATKARDFWTENIQKVRDLAKEGKSPKEIIEEVTK